MLDEVRTATSRMGFLELTLAVAAGVALGTLILTFTGAILMPLLAGALGQPDVESLAFQAGQARVRWGTFLTALLNFGLIWAAAMWVLRPLWRAARRVQRPDVRRDEAA